MDKNPPLHITTLASVTQLPELFKGNFLKGHGQSRVAFVGRSNVGKSSLINSLLERKLAYVSSSPGKTKEIHFYLWPPADRIIVDFPGYGFAQVSKTEREHWNKLIGSYLEADPNLTEALVLLDGRHGPTDSDWEAIEFLSFKGIPVSLIFTKADTLKTQSDRARRQKEVAEALKKGKLGRTTWRVFWVSSRTGHGMKALVQHLKSRVAEEGMTEDPA